MKKIFSIAILSAMVLGLASCDKIDDPIKPIVVSGGGKTVLLNDYTGVRCVNCPAAAELAHELQGVYGDQLIVMSIHAGYLSAPMGPNNDFRTEEGTIWYNGQSVNPLGSVDRTMLVDGYTLGKDQWEESVKNAFDELQSFELTLTPQYDSESRSVVANIVVEPIMETMGDLYMTACIVEDSIIGNQTVPGGVNPEYVHRHVFRKTFNGANGSSVHSGLLEPFDNFPCSFTTTLDDNFNENQCYVLVYIFDNDTKKIYQTVQEKLIQ